MSHRPDFSPDMLKFFLRARADHAVAAEPKPEARARRLARFKAQTRRLCGLTAAEFDLAWMGRLLRPEPRARIWAVLGHFPADFGIVLTQGDQEQ